MISLNHDPYNLIITGVGGQGNVISSRMIGNMLAAKGFKITIGETFGASQRGGSVMSHVRISSTATLSPQIPIHQAHMVVSLEPMETLRVLESYGNPSTGVICNTRPTHPIGVISGRLSYPTLAEMKRAINLVSERAWFFDATQMATEIGDPIFANIIMAGALAATGELPLDRQVFEQTLKSKFTPDKVKLNLTAFDQGHAMINNYQTKDLN
ncbi:IorB3 [Desulforapulum autotrophicum HRM2]|uniref:IorB3 n=1 Tax=Desulforapulum autotrophicum (strain ATCC 43914 / DSM 3382 / VKM B-1955 / HRM2) TaxID=177437 RepID=C0QMB0_DESAH|nr:indolepyruvate oxidoreductase subunit beta [Desulforapulum autotrophicum]ACN16427.1 IorB3 [Desulforapulum autotrophicum HRM2]